MKVRKKYSLIPIIRTLESPSKGEINLLLLFRLKGIPFVITTEIKSRIFCLKAKTEALEVKRSNVFYPSITIATLSTSPLIGGVSLVILT